MLNFLRFKWLYFSISSVLLVLCVYSLFVNGLKPAVDFIGGSVWELQFSSSVSQQTITSFLEKEGIFVTKMEEGIDNSFTLYFDELSQERKQSLSTRVSDSLGSFTEARFETLSPRVGRELVTKTVYAVIITTVLILAYLAWRLRNFVYGLSAVLAMFHDSLILLGVFSWLGKLANVSVDTLFVTAILTTLSLSVHDTVVIFSSIREELKRSGRNFSVAINTALTKTIVRSINNSLTIIFMLLALVVLGGETIRWFAAALLIGTVLGTYSSTFLAAPLLLSMGRIFKLKK